MKAIVYGLEALCQSSLTEPNFVAKYQTICARAESGYVKRFSELIDSLGFLANLKIEDITSLEIFGAWEEFCVVEGIVEALNLGINVNVPKGYVAALKERKMSFRELVALKSGGKSFGYYQDEEFHYFTPNNTKL
jgi:hypothetical protein